MNSISIINTVPNVFAYNVAFFLINIFFVLMLAVGLIIVIKKFVYKNKNINIKKYFLIIYQYTHWPLLFLVVTYLFYYLLIPISAYYPKLVTSNYHKLLNYLLSGFGIIFFFWLAYAVVALSKESLMAWARHNQHSTILVVLPAISESLNAVFLLLMFNLFIPNLGLTGVFQQIFEKGLKVLLILTLGWISFKLIYIFENIIINQHNSSNTTPITVRKLKTQISILRRIILTLIVIITTAAILMTFDSVKNLGAGILTTAGLVSAIGAFASQQSLSRIFSGLQLAFTQPIRIGDTVVVDNEFGQIEEINLSYVTIKLWDLRRLIKPTDYFTKNGVFNLTRESTQLLGTVMIYCDYTLPVDILRDKFKSLLERSKYWDKNVSELDVTDVTDKCMQVRLLISAENADLLWKLRCEIREKIMKYIVDEHPERLTRARNLTVSLTPSQSKT